MKPMLRTRYDEAVKLKNNGELILARKILEELAMLDSASPAVLLVLGDVLWELGKLSDAVPVFQKATELRPSLEVASLGLFHVLWELGDEKRALAEIKRFLQVAESESYEEIVDELHKECIDQEKP